MAIVKAANFTQNFERDMRFMAILYGPPSAGKTTLAQSAESPLTIDCDGGIGRVRADHRRDFITADSYPSILDDLQSPEARDYKTIVIDTGGAFISLLQAWAIKKDPKRYAKGDGTISLQGFGIVKSEFQRFVDLLRVTLKKHVIFVFHSVEEKKGENTVQRLLCDGAARNLVWLPADFGGYVGFDGQRRRISFTPCDEWFAKRTYGIAPAYDLPDLAPGTPNDFLQRLFAEARTNIRRDADEYAEARRKYADAVAKGREIVSAVTDAESAQAAADSIQALDHAMTSLPEVRALFARRLAEIGVKWDKARQAYVPIAPPVTDNAPPAPTATENPPQAAADAPQGAENPGAADNAPMTDEAQGEAA